MDWRQTRAMTIGSVLAITAGAWGTGPADERVVPSAEVTQVLLAGKNDVPRDFNPTSLVAIGDYLYTGCPQGNGTIQYFKRDLETGKIAYAGAVTQPDKNLPADLYAAGGRLYAYTHAWTNNKIVWYEVDAPSGKPVEKGSLEVTKNNGPGQPPAKVAWSGMAVASLDQKNLYVTADNIILWYKLDADGGLAKSGELAGKGIGMLLAIAPDGKHLYSISHDPFPAIACLECKPTGELAVKSVTPLDPKWKVANSVTVPSMSFTPDGKGLYVGYWNNVMWNGMGTTDSYLAIFRRDVDSGELKSQAAGCGNDTTQPDFQLANLRALNLVFLPDGLSGFACSGSGSLLRSFRRDATTGRLDSITDFPEWDLRKLATGHVVFDAKNNLLIGASANNFYLITHALWAAKTGVVPFKPYSAIKTTVTGGEAAASPAAAADWPCWRGPSHDLKSPLKSIRKDWTGGLKKVWEVEGLSPGTGTWSVPATSGDKLVVTGRHGWVDEVFCFDADKGGAPLWVAEIEDGEPGHFDWGSGPHATPAISGDKVYAATLGGICACLSMTDGRVLWRKLICSPGYTSSPLVVGDLVVFTGGGKNAKQLYACKKDTGEAVWTAGGASFSSASPVLVKLAGRDQIVHSDQHRIFGVDPLTGKQIWEYSNQKMANVGYNCPIATLAAEGDIIYSAWFPYFPTLQIADGTAKELWAGFSGKEKVNGDGTMSDPIILNGYLYTFSNGGGFQAGPGSLHCADVKTGELKWAEKIGNGSMVYVDGCLLCLTYGGDLVLVEPHPEGFKKLAEVKGIIAREPWPEGKAAMLNNDPQAKINPLPWAKSDPNKGNCAPCWTSPSVARGKVYIHYSDRLMCYDLMK